VNERVVIVVVGLLVLSVVMVGVAAISQRSATRARHDLVHTTRYDALTGLPNRTLLGQAIGRRLEASGEARTGALVVIELSRFEAVNETYGREVGDGLLVAAADQLRGATTTGEELFRVSGPQFAVLTRQAGLDTVTDRADTLRDALGVPFRIGTDHLRVATAAGVAIIEGRTERPDELLREADIALAQASRPDAGATTVFDGSMSPRVTATDAERRLRDSLDNDEFWVFYLPVVALANQELVGVEALLRWADPERGLISPADFLPMLDDSGLIGPVGEWVFQQACRQSVLWQERYPERDLVTTVNVSPRQLGRADFMDRTLATLRDTGADPTRICLELTEGSLMRDIDSSWSMLRAAKDAGIKLALDDFGTGYSSLAYLRRFSLDVLKIDRGFVANLGADREDEAIVQQIIALAHALGITPVAEGVDSAEQARTLHGLGCELAQGFFFSPPQPVSAIDHLLVKGTVSPGGSAPAIDWTGGGGA
jgi:diguanylate cyclase (GGDEF)-like protein